MTDTTTTIQAWTTENSDAVVWGTHDLAVAKEAYAIMQLDTEPDWGDVRLMWAAPHLIDQEQWADEDYGNQPEDGWVPYMAFGF
jgi:hypothetical protein